METEPMKSLTLASGCYNGKIEKAWNSEFNLD